jgi:hypothetical protein
LVDRENNRQQNKITVMTDSGRGPLSNRAGRRVSASLRQYPTVLKRKAPANFSENYVLPDNYNLTRLTLLARDPFWIHAYWDIAPADLEAKQRQLGAKYQHAALALRMYDVTCVDFNGQNANHSFDIDVGFQNKNWYMDIWKDNISFCADLGLRLPDGQFHSLTRSNFVHTPRVSASDRTDMIWMAVDDAQNSHPFMMTGMRPRGQHAGKGQRSGQVNINKSRRRKTYLSEEDIRAYYAKSFPLLKSARGLSKGKRKGSRGEDVREGMLPEDIYGQGLSRSQFLRKLRLGSSAELVERGGASEKNFQLEKGASERIQPQRKFFFEIWTELIVYGRTEPDAEVMLGKNKVPLRKDGTFTLRYALPDGEIPFDFMAQSADKIDRRYITTSVERAKTIYNP